ncbi:DNA polymerase III subunit gamma and tau [Microtetraspora malaysiensis]|uniref:DNA polymerase III subunit gamma and tau n=1 Tax=Microtetraspora malaysiensis TaxID=161358 RepID=UPI00083367EA|nr:DNA polymerase III subunit gamma and tau [Microtetraspora malaysiensis]
MSLALYRKYRPGTFAEVKGQEHVTEPLRQALRSGRINHAYLFSGPRGCGKTSSARILARSLNCEKGPTPDPCGECDSCVALGPTGPGHLDVIEIDAASHGGVDDARDLRERAFFAPVSARYKIYIIDEAHMVTREGFNALLKLVEEPPPHLKFVFATTEPEKVIGTIKSRTHHYPFRLMPPATLRQLMEEILDSESVPYEPTALPLVVRAGAGSARDSLSILDQLLAGADESGITYQRAVSLLGYTDGDLLDEVVEAFAKRDGAAVFQTVNRVIEGGHDPRRFAMDLLERFRDLVILANVPEAAGNGLLDRPADELERLQAQAALMGPAELTRAAEIFNTGLTEMRGAASPRLLLELMCARVLLPAAAEGETALLARLERLERLERGGVPGLAAPVPGVAVPAPQPSPAAAPAPAAPAAPTAPMSAPGSGSPAAPARTAPAPDSRDDWPTPARPGAASAPPRDDAPSAAPAAVGGPIQQAWPRVLDAIKNRQRVAWMILNTQGRLLGVDGNLVTVGFEKPGDVQGFLKGKRDEVVAAALGDVLGGTWRVDVVVGSSGPPAGAPAARGSAAPSGGYGTADAGSRPAARTEGQPRPSAADPRTPPEPAAPASGPEAGGGDAGASQTTDESWPDAPSDEDDGRPPAGSGGSRGSAPGPGLAAARSAAKAAAQSGPRQAWPEAVPSRSTPGQATDDVDPLNDADADGDELTGMALIQRELGGRVIEEIDHS